MIKILQNHYRANLQILLWISCFIFFSSCSKKKELKNNHTFFGGEIVNPITEYVVLELFNSKGDTISLNNNNRFYKTYDNPTPAVYNLKHHPEYQMFLLEPGDSIMVRLNTLEFDESLVFSGIGAKKNNFLIDMFLENEKERRFLATLHSLKPEVFLKKINELIAKRHKRFQHLKEKNSLSPIATKICEESFMYHYYAQKEQYILNHFQNNIEQAKEKFDALPKDLLQHRDVIDLNNAALANLYDYTLFLNIYINNVSFMTYATAKGKKAPEPEATLNKLELIDSLFKDENLRNIQIHFSALEYLYYNKNVDKESLDQILQAYTKISTSQKNIDQLMKRTKASEKLKTGDLIPDQELIGYDGSKVKMHDLLKKELTVFYFWSNIEFSVYQKTLESIKKLRNDFPQCSFIGINTDDAQSKKWRNLLNEFQYKTKYEYQFLNTQQAKEQLLVFNIADYKRNRAFIIDKNGKLLIRAAIINPEFPAVLQSYLDN